VADFLAAVDYNQRAEKAAQPLGDKKLEGSILNNMGLVYSELSQFEKAREAYRKYLAIARELNMRREEAIALMNTGLVCFKQGMQDDALGYFDQSLAIAETEGYEQVATYTLSNMGASLNKKGEYAKGLVSFQKSAQLANKIGDARIKVQSVGGMGESHFHLKNYGEAEKYTLQALQLAKEVGLVEYQKEMYQGLSEIYQKQNNSAQALEAYKTYIVLRDSILNDQKKQELTKKELQFEFEKKEAVLNAEHAAEIRQQTVVRNAVMGGAAALLLAAASSFLFYKKRRDADERRKEAEFSAQVSDTEMKALRSQMNPHFIFNSLNSISDFIAKHDVATADYYLTKFAKLMRLILENSEKKEVTLTDDLKALESYMQLELLRLNKKFTYEIHVDESIDKETTLIPPLLLQPFVENSIWHGVAGKKGDGKIVIRIEKENEMIRCVVEDDGVGRKQAGTGKATQSLGIKITKARIDILNRLKQSHAKVELSDLTQGTRVEVTLPLVLQF
jgi:tetratricopeptide (TPR) repeat protein